jgi:hypothetical protein
MAMQKAFTSTLPGGAARRTRPVHDAEHQLQMVRELGSSTLMHLRDDASAAQRAADASRLVLHALVVLPHPENRLAIGQGDAHAFPNRLRVFARERENIGQEGFGALVHFRPGTASCFERGRQKVRDSRHRPARPEGIARQPRVARKDQELLAGLAPVVVLLFDLVDELAH